MIAMKLPVGLVQFIGLSGRSYTANQYGTVGILPADVAGALAAGATMWPAGPPADRTAFNPSPRTGDQWYNSYLNQLTVVNTSGAWATPTKTLDPPNGAAWFIYPSQSGLAAVVV